ncbi:hypothetical protein HPP05_12870, partial [Corallococcus exiguus]|nr:hypothetical protein [Corallococcus exiguus]
MGQASRKDKDTQKQEGSPPAASVPSSPDAAQPAVPHEGWRKPAGMSRKGWAILAGAVAFIQLPLIHYALIRGQADVTATVPYQQAFNDPAVVARDFFSTGAYWRVTNGELLGPAPKNNPLWLQAVLPDDVAVEFDVRPEYPDGDIRVELFGNGRDPASGYVLVQGGWNNSLSVIARKDINAPALDALQRKAARVAEKGGGQGADLVATGVFKKDTRVRVESRVGAPIQSGRTYHWRIERRGNVLKWAIDGQLVGELDDPFPLKGKGQDRLGLSGWESQLFFDNLRIGTPDSMPATMVAKQEPTLPPGSYT